MVSLKGMGKATGHGIAKGTDAVISADLAAPAKCVQMRARKLNQVRKARKLIKAAEREMLATLVVDTTVVAEGKPARRTRKAKQVVEATAS